MSRPKHLFMVAAAFATVLVIPYISSAQFFGSEGCPSCQFNASSNTTTLNASVPNQYFNVTIGNNHTMNAGLDPNNHFNITELRIKLYKGMGLTQLNGTQMISNYSNANLEKLNNASFRIESNQYGDAVLVWTNTTPFGIVPWNLTRSFAFNLSVPLAAA